MFQPVLKGTAVWRKLIGKEKKRKIDKQLTIQIRAKKPS